MREYGNSVEPVPETARRGQARLVGFGLDDSGGHVRFTVGDGFTLIGGSADSHLEMQNRAEWILGEIRRRGFSLGSLTRAQYEELLDIVELAAAE
ncbi:MAG: hypothetical protein LBE84_09005 [Planctomycetota bacterium]|jgi:hypothetical protein|nr:hypothetical protein [Planctomycetota bacterium]